MRPICGWKNVVINNTTQPETKLTGVSYQYGGGWWSGTRDPVGFTVQDPNHWVYVGTGLTKGSVFGKQERLVGYEFDGAGIKQDSQGNYVLDSQGNYVLIDPNSTFKILGLAILDSHWEDRRSGNGAAATMGVWGGDAAVQGTVFTAATTDWARVLAYSRGRARKVVDGITRNVLDKLSSPR